MIRLRGLSDRIVGLVYMMQTIRCPEPYCEIP